MSEVKIGNQETGRILSYPHKKYINVFDLQPEDIEIEDIAHSTAHICRYNGHVSHFYSVAQHSVLVAQRFPRGSYLRKWGLLHDAPEYLIQDVVAPLKYSGHYGFYLDLEDIIMGVIAEKYGLEPEIPNEVKEVDIKLRGAEMRDLKGHEPTEETYAFTIRPWLPAYAKTQFLREALDLGLE